MTIKGEFKGSRPELYSEKPYSLPSYQPMQVGIEEIEAATQQLKKLLPVGVHSYRLTTKEVFTSGELVVEIGTYEMTVDVPHAEERMSDKGKNI